MLALTRKIGETIIIGDDIEIVVLNVSGDQVKLGIVAPKEISVHRKEIYEQIILNNKEATMSKSLDGIKKIFKNDLLPKTKKKAEKV